MSKIAQSFQDMEVYQESFRLQQEIFAMSKQLPAEERFSLTDQIRRSSRSIGANIAESWAKRRYPAHFLSKLTDADGELQETIHWIRSAAARAYCSEAEVHKLTEYASVVGRLLAPALEKASLGLRALEPRAMADAPDEGEVGEELALEDRLEVELDERLPGERGAVA